MCNFVPVGSNGFEMVEPDLKIWVSMVRLNYESVTYDFEVEYDPDMDRARVQCGGSDRDLLAGGARMPPYRSTSRMKSSQIERIISFFYRFPLDWVGDFVLVLSDTKNHSLSEAYFRQLESAGIPGVSDQPGRFFVEMLRATVMMPYERDFTTCPERIAIAVPNHVAASLARIGGGRLGASGENYTVLAERPGVR